MPIPLIFLIAIFTLVWVAFSVLVGIGGHDWPASLRLFSLGMGVLGVFLAFGAALFYLPDWLVVPLLLAAALLPWVIILRYFIMTRLSGRLLMALPYTNEKWSRSILNGAVTVMFGLSQLGMSQLIAAHNLFSSPAKTYALGIALICLGIGSIPQKIRCMQIRTTGILSSSGSFYPWHNIEGFTWKFGEDKLSLKLKKAIFNRSVDLKIRSNFRHEIVLLLEQNISAGQINP